MTRWDYTVDIRKFLTEDTSRQSMLQALDGIRQELASKLPPNILERAAPKLSEMDEAAKLGRLNWFNSSLDDLWDFFDENKIWVDF